MHEYNQLFRCRYHLTGPEILYAINKALQSESINEVFYVTDMTSDTDKDIKYQRLMYLNEFGSDYESKYFKITINKKNGIQQTEAINGFRYYWNKYFNRKSNITVKSSTVFVTKDPMIRDVEIEKYYLGPKIIYVMTFHFHDQLGFANYNIENLDVHYRRAIIKEVSSNEMFKYDFCFASNFENIK